VADVPLVPLANHAAVPVAAAPTKTTQPAKLTWTEGLLAGLLILAGVAMITLLLVAFMTRGQDWSLISKETTEVTAATGSAAEKKTTTVEYSDSVLITGMVLGSVFLLTGAFFGRIREITLPGGAALKIGELPPEKEKELKDAIAEKAQATASTPEVNASPEELAKEAAKQADLVFHDQYWGAVPQPSTGDLEQIAGKAVERAAKLLAG